jgi:hypothetical protein
MNLPLPDTGGPPGWQAWENLGGVAIGPAAICSRGEPHNANAFDIVVRGSDNRLWQNHFQTYNLYGDTYPGSVFSQWRCAGGPNSGYGVVSAPGAAYGHKFQADTYDNGYPYATWDAVVVDPSGRLRRVAWYGDPPVLV